MHNGIMHCATVPPGAVSVLLMHLLRQEARLRNEAHVAHVAGTEEGSVETEEGRQILLIEVLYVLDPLLHCRFSAGHSTTK